MIFKAGDPGGLAYVIQKGTVHVSIKDANNETAMVDIADEGGLIGMSSLLAASQAPIIMMSQIRQDARDRVRSELDCRVNLKAKVEIEV